MNLQLVMVTLFKASTVRPEGWMWDDVEDLANRPDEAASGTEAMEEGKDISMLPAIAFSWHSHL